MDVGKLFDIAAKLPDAGALLQDGAAFVAAVRDNAALAAHVLTDGDWAELDAIHTRALAAADDLDAKLAAAARR